MNSTEKLEMQVDEESDGSATVSLPEHMESPDDMDDNRGSNDAAGSDPDREAIRAARREERNLKKRFHKAKINESSHLINSLKRQNEHMAERLAALGLTVLQLEPKDQADAVRVIRTVAQALYVPDPETVIRQIEQEFAQAQALMPQGARGKKVYFEVGTGPYAAGAASFIGQTLSQLGLVNIVGPELGPFPKINPELVVRLQPDVVVVADSSFSALAGRPGWGMVRALKDHKVCTFSQVDGDLLVRAGPRMGQGALLLARCLQRLYSTGQTP
jgi:ABC-type Fe3+-hydroxamate transport system substrate-binding protein